MFKTIDRIILIILTILVWGLIATFWLKPTSGFAQNSVKDLPPFKSSLRDKQPVPKKEEIVEKKTEEDTNKDEQKKNNLEIVGLVAKTIWIRFLNIMESFWIEKQQK